MFPVMRLFFWQEQTKEVISNSLAGFLFFSFLFLMLSMLIHFTCSASERNSVQNAHTGSNGQKKTTPEKQSLKPGLSMQAKGEIKRYSFNIHAFIFYVIYLVITMRLCLRTWVMYTSGQKPQILPNIEFLRVLTEN